MTVWSRMRGDAPASTSSRKTAIRKLDRRGPGFSWWVTNPKLARTRVPITADFWLSDDLRLIVAGRVYLDVAFQFSSRCNGSVDVFGKFVRMRNLPSVATSYCGLLVA